MLLFLVACGGAPGDGEAVPDAPGAGRTNDELAAAWWNWAAIEPDSTDPVVDETGEDCARNQPDDVWFLAGNFGGETIRECAVPADRPIFLPVLNELCGPGEGCEASLDDAELQGTLDGEPLAIVEIDTEPFTLKSSPGNTVTGEGGESEAVAAGWWARVGPLDPGTHDLKFSGRSPDGFELEVTYALKVA